MRLLWDVFADAPDDGFRVDMSAKPCRLINMSNQKVTRIRAGLYRVATNGRTFTVEQIRTETPGYGVENRWWISAADNGPEVYIDPQATKADALDALSYEA